MPSNQSLRKARYRAARRRRKYFAKNHSVELKEGDETMEIKPTRFFLTIIIIINITLIFLRRVVFSRLGAIEQDNLSRLWER